RTIAGVNVDIGLNQVGAAHLEHVLAAGRLGLALALLEPEREVRKGHRGRASVRAHEPGPIPCSSTRYPMNWGAALDSFVLSCIITPFLPQSGVEVHRSSWQ